MNDVHESSPDRLRYLKAAGLILLLGIPIGIALYLLSVGPESSAMADLPEGELYDLSLGRMTAIVKYEAMGVVCVAVLFGVGRLKSIPGLKRYLIQAAAIAALVYVVVWHQGGKIIAAVQQDEGFVFITRTPGKHVGLRNKDLPQPTIKGGVLGRQLVLIPHDVAHQVLSFESVSRFDSDKQATLDRLIAAINEARSGAETPP